MTHRTVIRFFSGTLLAALVLGCGSDNKHPTDTGPFLTVTPLFKGLLEGSTAQVTAKLGDEAVPVTWESSDTKVITVSASGLVTAVGAGMAAATATMVSGGTKKSASFTVTSPPTLVSGTAVTAISGTGARGTIKLYKIVVPAGATSLSIRLSGGTGDVDLYMQQGTPPTITSYGLTSSTCSSENGGNGEICTIPSPVAGTWFVALGLWDPYAGVTLTPTITP